MSSNSIVEKGLYLADVLICKFIIHIRFHQPQLPFSNDCLLRWHVFSIKDWAVGLAGRSKDVDVWIRGNWPTGLSGNVEILWNSIKCKIYWHSPWWRRTLLCICWLIDWKKRPKWQNPQKLLGLLRKKQDIVLFETFCWLPTRSSHRQTEIKEKYYLVELMQNYRTTSLIVVPY